MTSAARALIALSVLFITLAACSSARPSDDASASPISAADQEFIQSRHGGM